MAMASTTVTNPLKVLRGIIRELRHVNQELYTEYHGKGERSVGEAANLVGLRLPKLYTENTEEKK